MSKKNEKILELGFTIEALQHEITDLEERLTASDSRLWEIIKENDRLTLTYEPYRPPGDTYEGLEFFELVEENEALAQDLLDKDKSINGLENLANTLQMKNNKLASELYTLRREVEKLQAKTKKYPKAGSVSFDFWPWRDWFRLSYSKWNPGKYAQLCIGPLRIDWFAS